MPQRIRAGCDGIFTRLPTTQTALPQRIRAGCDSSDRRRGSKDSSLPQRIRAGCDSMDPFTANNLGNFATAHSRGLIAIRQSMVFATAHSRGLRQYYRQYVQMLLPLPQRIRAGCDRLSSSTSMRVTIFATAHSRGLRPPPANRKNRIIHFATAHSCGLRRCYIAADTIGKAFATAHSCGLRLRKSNAAHCEFAARR